jgi:hypothetical protein
LACYQVRPFEAVRFHSSTEKSAVGKIIRLDPAFDALISADARIEKVTTGLLLRKARSGDLKASFGSTTYPGTWLVLSPRR